MKIPFRFMIVSFIILLMGLAGFRVWQFWSSNEVSVLETAAFNSECDLHTEQCEQVFDHGGRVSFSISPRPIQGMKPLILKVETEDIDVNSVKVDFQSSAMNMGFNRPRLEKKSDDLYSGSGMLSLCVLRTMPWEARVLVETDKGTLVAPFRFNVESR